MTSIEDLVRESLRQRAEDVEPTPALWLEVDRRVTRRRRFQVASWSLVGVAAALAALAIVPGLLTGGTGTGLEIDPMDRLPASGVVPELAVLADGGELSLVDLTGGSEPTVLFEGAGEIVQAAVRPGSSADDYDLAVVRIGADGVAELLFASAVDGELSQVEGRIPEHAVSPGFVPTVAWGPQGRQLLYTIPADADGAIVVVQDVPPTDGTYVDASRGTKLAVVENSARVVDWIGATGSAGDASRVVLRRTDGQLTALELSIDADSRLVLDDTATMTSPLPGTVGVAWSHASTALTQPVFVLAGGGEPVLGWAPNGLDDSGLVSVPLSEVFGDDVPTGDLWLAARQDAALIGDGERTWLVAHDGAGAFAPAVQLAARGTTGALFDAVRPGSEGEAPTEEPAPEEHAEAPDAAPEDDGTPGSELPAPIVTVSQQELMLTGPAGTTTLVTLDDEGGSWFHSAQVRPGSTLDDLVVVALTTAEGMYDLRHLHVVDGEVVTWEAFEAPHVPGFGGDAGSGVSIWGPLWSPDGAHLAWFEFGTGPATLRTIGWSDGPGTGEPATDNASFTLEDLPTQPLVPMEWVEVPGTDGMTEIRATWGDFNGGWFTIPLQIQGDGAIAQPGGRGWDVQPGADGAVSTFAVAGAPGRGGIRFMVQDTATGFDLVVDPYGDQQRITLPEEIGPGDGIPEFWVRSIGEGALVGSPNTALAWYVTADGALDRLPGQVVHADVVR